MIIVKYDKPFHLNVSVEFKGKNADKKCLAFLKKLDRQQREASHPAWKNFLKVEIIHDEK